MRLSGNNELIAIGVVILVTCFSPSLVSPLVRSQVGKAVALAGTAWVALHVSQPLALFLAVLVVTCCSGGGMEYMCVPATAAAAKSEAACTAASGKWKDAKCEC